MRTMGRKASRLMTSLAVAAMVMAGQGAAQGAGLSVTGVDCITTSVPYVCWAPLGTSMLDLVNGSTTPTTWYTSAEGSVPVLAVVASDTTSSSKFEITFRRPAMVRFALSPAGPIDLTLYGGVRGLPPLPKAPLRTGDPVRNAVFPMPGPGSAAAQLAKGVALLERAHAAEGIATFHLPRGFAALSPIEQLFVITNFERISRGLWPLYGVDAVLDRAAMTGALKGRDPSYAPHQGWAANWAGGVSALTADALWMYRDGLGSENVDCRIAGQAGCWGHRHDVLGDYGPYGLFGAAIVKGSKVPYGEDVTELFLVGFAPPAHEVIYTWAQAVAGGARPAR